MVAETIEMNEAEAKGKIVLINPDLHLDYAGVNFSLALLSVGSYLDSKGHNVTIIDYNNFEREEEFYAALGGLLPDAMCIGISCMTVQVKSALKIARFVREKNSKAKIVWGGVHPTLFPEETLKSDAVDHVITGDGELAFQELLEKIGRGEKTEKIMNGQFINLNNEPPINWKLQYIVEKRGLREIAKKSPLWFYTSKGCPYQCTFCINVVAKSRYRMRDIGSSLKEMLALVKATDAKKINLMDELFFSSRKRVEEFIDGILKSGLKFEWYANLRADAIRKNLVDYELMERAKKAGLSMVGLGGESGSELTLRMLRKEILPRDIVDTAVMLDKLGIKGGFSFMYGLPGETLEEFYKTLMVMKQIHLKAPSINIVGPQFFRPYPGSKLYLDCVEKGLKVPQSLEEWADKSHYLSELTAGEASKYPWVGYDIKKANTLIFYMKLAFNPMGDLKGKYVPIFKVLNFLAQRRYDLNFFAFPIEEMLYKKLNSAGTIQVERTKGRVIE